MSGKYYPNNWKLYKDAPEDAFYTPTFEEFKEWKIGGWELPESIVCIIRAELGGKIKEYVYQQGHAAEKRVEQLIEDGVSFTVCDNESIHHLIAHDSDD